MGLEAQIHEQLAATSVVTDEVSVRIYRHQRARGTVLPAVVFERAETNIVNHATGATTTETCTMQVDSYASTLDGVRTLADAVKTALSGWSNTGGTPSISMSHQVSDFDVPADPEHGTDAPVYRITQDYLLSYGV